MLKQRVMKHTWLKDFRALVVVALCTLMLASSSDATLIAEAKGSPALSYWTDTAPAKTQLQSYMAQITDKNSQYYIPVSDRIAVFDLDGTLCCETDPVYFDHELLVYRVFGDPTYKDKASDFEKAVAAKVLDFANTGTYPEELSNEHGQAVASAFAGMTVDEFLNYVKAFGNTPMNGYNGMKKGDAFYQPMVQIINYLQQNDFTVYIVSGTDRLILRGLVDGKLPVPPRQIIGSDEAIVAKNQNGEEGLTYQFKDNDSLVLGGNFIIKNLKMNKVAVISQEIGQQPVLSFGNSSGDYSMAKYVTSNNKYKSLAFMLCCDDTVRENGKASAAEKMYKKCAESGWIPVSMKNDWTTIYGPGVSKK